MSLWNRFRKTKASNIVIVFAVVQIACLVFGILFPSTFRYLSQENLQILFKSIPQLAILAVGVGLLMIAGEFDLSVGSNFTLTAFVMATCYNSGLMVIPSALLGILAGAFIGMINGLIVIKANIPSFIATLGSMMFWRGIILIFTGASTEPFIPNSWFDSLFAGSIGFLQAQFLWLVLVAIGGYLLLERHKFGNQIFAVGGNRQSAIAIGVNPDRVKLICFTLTGVLAAFSGLVSTVRVHSVSPVQGQGLELQAIAACVIGGVSLTGGSGTILGIFLGSALLFTIQDILLLLRAPGFYLEMFMGILIVIAVIFNNLTRKE
jgi:ribose/xylose/arabinose/galactoside ABC-type transport system permease subunit